MGKHVPVFSPVPCHVRLVTTPAGILYHDVGLGCAGGFAHAVVIAAVDVWILQGIWPSGSDGTDINGDALCRGPRCR